MYLENEMDCKKFRHFCIPWDWIDCCNDSQKRRTFSFKNGKEYLQNLLKIQTDEETKTLSVALSIKDCLEEQDEVDSKYSRYINRYFGALFSAAKNVLTDSRKRIYPQFSYAFVFLKLNRSYWNAEPVRKAINTVRSSIDADRITAHEILPRNNAEELLKVKVCADNLFRHNTFIFRIKLMSWRKL